LFGEAARSAVARVRQIVNYEYRHINDVRSFGRRRHSKTCKDRFHRNKTKTRQETVAKQSEEEVFDKRHFYDRETSFFTPPHGSQTSVWVTSLVNTQEVINLMLDKYKVDSDGSNFALFVVRDNGGICTMDLIVPYVYSLFAEQRRLKEEEYPLLTRVFVGASTKTSPNYS
jgi:hypothetical protein